MGRKMGRGFVGCLGCHLERSWVVESSGDFSLCLNSWHLDADLE